MTYKEIQNKGEKDLGIAIKNCWIAYVKRELGLVTKTIHNRISQKEVKYPSPDGPIKECVKNANLYN
jgi:hypothetical protein